MKDEKISVLIKHYEEGLIALTDLAKARYKLNYERKQLENAENFNHLVVGMHKTRVENAEKQAIKAEKNCIKLLNPADNYIIESIKLQELLS
jgi:hypothetical protein